MKIEVVDARGNADALSVRTEKLKVFHPLVRSLPTGLDRDVGMRSMKPEDFTEDLPQFRCFYNGIVGIQWIRSGKDLLDCRVYSKERSLPFQLVQEIEQFLLRVYEHVEIRECLFENSLVNGSLGFNPFYEPGVFLFVILEVVC